MVKNLSIQFLVFLVIFQLLSWLRETSMLASNSEINLQHSLLTLTGDKVSLANSSKDENKKLVLYFFAPWCQVCHASIENLQNNYEKHNNIDVIAIALDFSDEQEVKKFVQLHKLTFPVALGNEQVKQYFQITGYPSYYVVDTNNKVIGKSLGYSTELGIYLRSL